MNIDFRYFIAVIALFFGLCAASCTQETAAPRMPEQGSELTLYVPAIDNFQSRSAGETNAELKYTSLYFFAFPADGSAPTISSLPVDDNSLAFEQTYRTYPIKLSFGRYKFYLVANLYDTDTDVDQLPQTENELKNTIHLLPEGFACRIPEKGLPMSATHNDFRIKDSGGALSTVDADGYYYNGREEALFATLSFLYAKITVIPNDAFGYPAQMNEIGFANLSTQEPVFFRNNFNEYGSQDIALADTEGSDIPSQHIFYIPERHVEESLAGQQSALSFKIGEKEVILPLGEAENDAEQTANSVPTADTHRKIVRGTHYKYTLNTLADIRFEVSDWNPEKIMAEFDDPVYLHIEQQEYSVRTGETTEIWFKSDVEDVCIESPTYSLNTGDPADRRDVPLYKCTTEYYPETEEGILRISVNEDIPYSEYDNILNDADKYNFFHIVAGPIFKRIKVTPLVLGYYLNISPTNIIVDVGQRIASNEYEGGIPVTIRTNYPTVCVSISSSPEWTFIHHNNTDDSYLKLVSSDNSEVTDDNASIVSVGSAESIIYNILFKGLNTGSEIWDSNRTLEFMVTGIDGDNRSAPIPVTVNIIPLLHDYKIHFKADGWKAPHIYVYECLEFPADYNNTYSPGNGLPEETLASKPIGYYAGKQSGKNIYLAALEYSFTGAVAFKGWDNPANREALYYSNGTLRPFEGYKDQGFFIFTDQQDTWCIEKKEQAYVRYNYNMDFCEEYRTRISQKCPDCLSSKNCVWPGICMEEEEDGWYVFNLTGIAKPGKALIMFADGHTGSQINKYPGSYEVGIPLFDYPSKEGWLYYNGVMSDRINNQFTSTKPE